MPSSQSIRAARAFVELFALRRAQDKTDDSKLVRGLRRAENRPKAFGEAIRSGSPVTLPEGFCCLPHPTAEE